MSALKNLRHPRFIMLIIASVVVTVSAFASGQSVLRNGSFEGSYKYWICEAGSAKFVTDSQDALTRENPAVGQYALKLDRGYLSSTPFALPDGAPVTIDAFVRCDKESSVTIVLYPSKRDTRMRPGIRERYRLTEKVGPEWKKLSFTVTPQQTDKLSNWMLVIYPKDHPTYVDGVSVVPGEQPAEPFEGYTPRREVEVTADVTNLPGYTANGNVYSPGASATIQAAVSNPGAGRRDLRVRWQLFDYTGARAVGEGIERKVAIEPGACQIETASLRLDERGLMLARVTVIDSLGSELDRSETPLTVLPFPKSATSPEPRERIGASLRGPVTMKNGQAIGFRWVRWHPRMGWSNVQKGGPDEWNWPDDTINALFESGYGVDMVMYGTPTWAVEKGKRTPEDMDWPADDPRWSDLSIETSWDKYVRAAVTRFKGKPVAWEFANEPDHRAVGWTSDLYTAMATRTGHVIKQVDPNAIYLTNQTYPWATPMQNTFFSSPGARTVDAHSWHNYGTGAMGSAKTINGIADFLKQHGVPDVEIWFNEGGAFVNSSQDYAAPAVGDVTPAQWASITTKSVAEMLAAGADRHILFHIGYENQGRSWFDWLTNGGTELWDVDSLPTIGVATWNVLIDQIGFSDPIKVVETQAFTAYLFKDLRHGRPVAVVFAKQSKPLNLRINTIGLEQLDVMGNAKKLADASGATVLLLPADGTPVYVYPVGPSSDVESFTKGFDSATVVAEGGN